MKISIIGLGKLGAPMAAVMAHKGNTVVGVDVNPAYVAAIQQALPPVNEPGLADLITANRERLSATEDYEAAILATDVTFIIVPTPSDPDGRFSMRYVLSAAAKIGAALRKKDAWHLVVLSSTVMPGSTGGQLLPALEAASGKKCGPDFGLCYNPEFIALGSVIRDFLNPDFLLVGESDDRAGAALEAVYRRALDVEAPVARMNFVNAELAKLSVNTFVTTKIAYANMLARICERLPEADVDVVTDAIGLDTRIGRKYLRGTISYGGPCFPRDNVALATLARNLGAPAFVAEATDNANRDGIGRLADIVEERLPEGGTAAVLGLSYKPNTDVVDESPGLLLLAELTARGVEALGYDPAAMGNARRLLGDSVALSESLAEAVSSADVIVLATAWDEFKSLDAAMLERDGRRRVVVDCWRVLPADEIEQVADYVVLGKGGLSREAVVLD
jgi:UDPglucose 6-dehydrogenase